LRDFHKNREKGLILGEKATILEGKTREEKKKSSKIEGKRRREGAQKAIPST